MNSRYLPAEALAALQRMIHQHPGWVLGMYFLITAALYGVFRWKAGRHGGDLGVMALASATVVMFAAACLVVLSRSSGYRVF